MTEIGVSCSCSDAVLHLSKTQRDSCYFADILMV